jgi:hypothetical protein
LAYTIPTSGPVTVEEIYYLLLKQGFSTMQAVGIMANMYYESSFNPEAENPGGPGAGIGLCQWEVGTFSGATSSLRTGNPQKDVRTQIAFLAKTVTQSSISGKTPADVGGNFAQNYERCASCQPGGQEYQLRSAMATKIAGIAKSGDWATASISKITGSGGGGSGSGSASTKSAGPGCLIGFSGVPGTSWISDIFSSGGNVGQTCLFTKTEARALIGGTILVAGAGMMLTGMLVLMVSAFTHTRAGRAAGTALGTGAEYAGAGLALAGMPEAGATVAAAGKGVKRGSSSAGGRYASRRASASRESRQRAARDQDAQAQNDEALYKKVAARKNDSSKGRALRDDEQLEPVPF